MASKSAHNTVYLKDYRPPPFLIPRVALTISIDDAHTLVRANLTILANQDEHRTLILDGRSLDLLSLKLNGEPLTDARWQKDKEHLTIVDVPDAFNLEIETKIYPHKNESLEGLYCSNHMFCTQCEAEGFRKITYFVDRPDNMAVYTTRIEAPEHLPVLLANGNLQETGSLGNGRHYAVWEDPFKKPSYLFAMVAGELEKIEARYRTRTGRSVRLQVYAQPHNIDKCDHALASLKKAMAWDEQVYGLECDLDQFMIVAVDDFNAGAMENKGLNIFNSKYVLARPQTATDDDYEAIEGVVAHEYFHNWTGNRVTCRDWFQLSLKEGLTVFRDQQFSAAMSSAAVKRIHDVFLLRNHQFPEDAGPMAHPIRPESYIEINNFYTLTVYEKGAEVIRMLQTIMGDELFIRGVRHYLQRHDGEAATTDDFVAALEQIYLQAEAPELPDFSLFKKWYSQAGTPTVTVQSSYDSARQELRLKVRQQPSEMNGQAGTILHVPLKMALFYEDGSMAPLKVVGEAAGQAEKKERVLHLTAAEQEFVFTGVVQKPIPSLLRGFSAPVKLEADLGRDELEFLVTHDTDPFNRWESVQRILTNELLELVRASQQQKQLVFDERIVELFGQVLSQAKDDDRSFIALLLKFPTEEYISEQMEIVDVDAVHQAREFVRRQLAERLQDQFLASFEENVIAGEYRYHPEDAGRRRLKNACLGYLMVLDRKDIVDRCFNQMAAADNMTDEFAALQALAFNENLRRQDALEVFYEKWKDNTLVMDKWFAVQASAPLENTFHDVRRLSGHPLFTIKNPNRVRALIGAFAMNQVCFHRLSGEGYALLKEYVLKIDQFNPNIAARLVSRLSRWKRYDHKRAQLMKNELENIRNSTNLSKGVFEIISRSLL